MIFLNESGKAVDYIKKEENPDWVVQQHNNTN